MSRTCLTFLALAALVSCESGTALQLVSARVPATGLPGAPRGVGAWSGEDLVGWSSLDESGTALLAVPAADEIGIALTDVDGRRLFPVEVRPGVPLVLRVCRPSSDTLDLGEIRADPIRCRPPPDCRDEWEAVRDCRGEAGDACTDCPPGVCERFRRLLDDCLDGRDLDCHDAPPSAMVQIPPPPNGIGCTP